MIIAFIIAILWIVVIAKWFRKVFSKPDPPGPSGLPILGYYPFLGENPFETFHHLADKYGEIMKVNMLNKDYYVLNSFEIIKEAFIEKGNIIYGRPQEHFSIRNYAFGEKDVINSEGDYWRVHKTFIVRNLTALGMGRSEIEPKILQYCKILIDNIAKEKGKAFDVNDYLANFTCNIISLMLFSKSYELDDPEYRTLKAYPDIFVDSNKYIYGILVGDLFYYFIKMKPKIYEKMLKVHFEFNDFIAEIIKRRMKEESAQEYNDLVQMYLDEKEGSKPALREFEALVANVANLFVGGVDIITSTLYFGINLIVLNQDVQAKMQLEIEEKIGKEREVSLAYRAEMPYTQAVIAEVQRFACLVPGGLIRVSMKDVNLGGYDIPARSLFIANFWRVSRNKRHFANPYAFDPNHFLDENGNFKPNEAHLPFSIGKRKCLAHKLAQDEIFIAFVTLLQKFNWRAPNGTGVYHKVKEGFVRSLEPFAVCAFPR